MKEESLWTRYSDNLSFPRLLEDITVDVAIIGGGITGVTTAALLADSGKKIALLEARQIGRSSSGFSTGNLYEILGDELSDLVQLHGAEKGNRVVSSRREAILLIERMIERFSIDCDFRRVPRYFYASVKTSEQTIENEAKTQALLNLPFTYGPFPEKRLQARVGIVNDDQAQFNPQRYIEKLAEKINCGNVEIYERSAVEKIEKIDGRYILYTDHGIISAEKIIHATHTPKGLMTYHTLLGPYREYGLAFKINGRPHPPGIFFGYFGDFHVSTRGYERDREQYLVVVGSPHKVGQGDSVEEMNRLEIFARAHFDVVEVVERWGAQQYKTTDYLPYIGHKSKGEDVFIATGFSAHGLTYGTVAAQILADQILGRENPYADLYSPTRLNPLKSAPKFIKENANVFYEYVKDYVLENYPQDLHDVAAAEGKIVSFDGKKIAVSRDEEGHLHVCSAICPHLAGVVHWNNAEKTWDCPCHGSRFTPEGDVLEGPAFKGLQVYQLADLEEKAEKSKKESWIPRTGISPSEESGLI